MYYHPYPYSYDYPMYNEDYLRPAPQVAPFIGPGAIQPHIGPGAIQPQPTPSWPTPSWPPSWPPVPPTGQGCMNKWARFRLKDGRVINMYVTHIDSKSVAGSVWIQGSGWKQVGLDLDEILESQC
ncbi:hypothetical protein CON48_16035 [Bacillus thuringiensis]|uniref:Uncharacterized protein n=1 Tax=Bacillus thuringiensis TaxID=1428 RepID=A0ABD6SR70_BACTU|nr:MULTISPECIES: hypothetical protein [Bacillus cereus group]EOO05481.1 hypothetical protein IAW_05147 [Bacillus cereus str. Schrouff]EOO82385.1 hypothetical protein IGY_05242 [Bacillus cereus K-5975c]MBJ8089970.1 hypothetical protein [Bacillus cereus]MCU4886031.1 hypothetical protein [Bacillus cereus]MCU4897207.1 hypothetical protein [Bacillus cereus]